MCVYVSALIKRYLVLYSTWEFDTIKTSDKIGDYLAFSASFYCST